MELGENVRRVTRGAVAAAAANAARGPNVEPCVECIRIWASAGVVGGSVGWQPLQQNRQKQHAISAAAVSGGAHLRRCRAAES